MKQDIENRRKYSKGFKHFCVFFPFSYFVLFYDYKKDQACFSWLRRRRGTIWRTFGQSWSVNVTIAIKGNMFVF